MISIRELLCKYRVYFIITKGVSIYQFNYQTHVKLEASNAAAGAFKTGPKYIGSRDDKQEAFTGLIDEIAFFNAVLSDNDMKVIANSGLSVALGFASVSPQAKLTTVWAKLKSEK